MSKFKRFYVDGDFEDKINKELNDKNAKVIKWDLIQRSGEGIDFRQACVVVEYKD